MATAPATPNGSLSPLMGLPLPGDTDVPDIPRDLKNIVLDLENMFVGMIYAFGGATPPDGWLICDGRSLAQATYPVLFARIGSVYGGSATHFNIPNLVNRTVVGAGSLGQVGTGILTTANLPSHQHTINHDHPAFNVTGGSHSHTIRARTKLPSNQEVPQGNNVSGAGGTSTLNEGNTAVNTSSSHTHSVNPPSYAGNSGVAGSSSPTAVQPPHVRLHWVIFAGRV